MVGVILSSDYCRVCERIIDDLLICDNCNEFVCDECAEETEGDTFCSEECLLRN